MEPSKTTTSVKNTGITVTLSLSMLLASLGTSITNIALPELVQAFMAPFAQVQAVVVAYLVALTISSVIAGQLGDKRGLKPMLVSGLVLFTLASLLCALMPTLWLLVGARGLQGIGAAFLMTLSMALMRQTTDKEHIGRAMGILGTVSALGTALGPALGGLLLPITGWRGIFWIQVPLAALAFILAVTVLPNSPTRTQSGATGITSALLRGLIPHLLLNVLVAAIMMTTLVVGPFFLSIGLALTTAQVGLVMTIGPVISVLSGVPSGRLVDEWGSGRILSFGLFLMAAGSFLMASLPEVIGVIGYILSLAVLTPGYQLFQAANNTAALAEVRDEQRGTASGLLSLFRNIGLVAGASIMGAVFAYRVGTNDIVHASAQATSAGMTLTFLLAGILMTFAIFLVFINRYTRVR